MSSLLHAARSAYATGLCLLPVRDDGSKAPATSAWTAFKTTRPTLDQMRAWDFATQAGLGVVGGAVSGCVDPWDFDCFQTFELFVETAQSCGLDDVVRRIRAGFEVETPSGGRRWLVRYPADLPFQDVVFARRPARDGEPVKTLIEITLFSVIAPSNGATHPSGRPYRQLSGGFDVIPTVTADERAALFALARSFDEMPARAHEPTTTTRTRGTSDLKPGDDFNVRASWTDVLPDWTDVYHRGDTIYLRRPGKDVGISATINHLGTDRLHVFTSSSAFDADTSYSKFGALTALHHGGDFGRAALALSRQGYGAGAARAPRTQTPPEAPAAGVAWRWLRDIKREYVDWLWRFRLARGTLTLWIGDGGLGKSRASNDVAARISTGACWPDGGTAALGSVVILSAEDSASYTIRPAIEAAGGDVSRVAVLEAMRDADGQERTFSLATDLAMLEQLIETTGAALVVIDPLSAYFGTRLDSYRDTDVRSVLEPVAKLAERHQVVMLGIMHIGKATDRQARHRALGSVAFINAARLVFAIGMDPDDPSRRLLVPVRSNICREAPPLAFRLEDADGVPQVVWEDGPIAEVSAETVLGGRPVAEDDERHDADALLRELLEEDDWPMAAATVAAAGRAHGIHVRSLQRAAHRVGIGIKKTGFRTGWFWFKPEVAEDDTQAHSSPADDDAPDPAPKPTPKTTEGVSGCDVSSSADDLSSSEPPKATVSSSSSSQKGQQNIHLYEDDNNNTPRARETPPIEALTGTLHEVFGAGTVTVAEPSMADRWKGRLPGPGEPPFGISPTAWADDAGREEERHEDTKRS